MSNLGGISWNRLISSDVEASKKFYSDLFGWDVFEVDIEGYPYFIFRIGSNNVAGLMQIPQEWMTASPPVESHWTSYFKVDDIDLALKKAESFGAERLFSVRTIKTLGKIATIKDPQGSFLGLFQSE